MVRSGCHIICAILAWALALHSVAGASTLVLQPDEPQSKDAWAYQFFPTTDMNVDFFAVLPVGNTGSFSAHSQQSFVQFDLSGVTSPASRISSATLQLHVIPSEMTGFGSSPSAAYPIDVSVYPVTGNWNESITWNTRPSVGATAVDTLTFDGSEIDNWVSFDVTNLVKQWVSGETANLGFGLLGDNEVRDETNTAVITVFESASLSNKPLLAITFSSLPGDANSDDRVDIADLYALASNWQRSGDALWEHGDFDGDHAVTASDLALLGSNWQVGVGDSVDGFSQALTALGLAMPVPEPSAGALLGVAALALGRRSVFKRCR